MLFIIVPQQVNASDKITIIVNNQVLEPSVDPILLNDRTLVPLRSICEALGCSVEWSEEWQTAQISHPVSIVNMSIGSYWFKKNSLLDGTKNVEVRMDIPPIIYNGSTLVPIRSLAEAINATVNWDDSSQTVRITLYEYDSYYADDGWAKVKKGSLFGFVNKEGTVIVPVEYDEIDYRREGLVGVRKGDKWGFYNEEGERVTPLVFDDIWYFESGFASVSRNGKWGFINKQGNIVTPLKYDAVWYYESGYAICGLGDKWGAIAIGGKVAAEFVRSAPESIYLAALPDYSPKQVQEKRANVPVVIKINDED